jgi:hypothetical protein
MIGYGFGELEHGRTLVYVRALVEAIRALLVSPHE